MRGPPSVAGRDRVKGQGNAALGKGTSRTVRSNLERGYHDKSPRWSAGRRACPARAGGAPSQKVPQLLPAPFRRSASLRGGNEESRAEPGKTDREIWRSARKRRVEPRTHVCMTTESVMCVTFSPH